MSALDVKKLREQTGAGFLDCKKAVDASNGDMVAAVAWLQERGVAQATKKADRIAAEGLSSIVIEENKAVIVEINSETDFVAKNEKFLELVNSVAKAILVSGVKTLEEAQEIDMGGKTLAATLTEATAIIGEKITLRRFELVTKTDTQVFGPYLHQGGLIGTLSIIEGGKEDAARGISMHVAAINPEFMSESDIDSSILEDKLAQLTKDAIDSGKPEKIAGNIAKGKLDKELSENVLTKQEYVKGDGETVEKFLAKMNATIVKIVRFSVGEGIDKKEDNFVDEVAAQVAQATK